MNASWYYSTGTLIDLANVTLAGSNLTVSCSGGFSTNGTGWAGAPANSADSGASVTNTLLQQAFAYTDGIYIGSGAAAPTLNIALTGLLASTTYGFSIYGGRTTGPANALISAAGNFALAGDTTIENRSVADFTLTSDSSGNITFSVARIGSTGSALVNAMSFTAVPEPADYGLAGAGVLAAVAAVRRRRKVS